MPEAGAPQQGGPLARLPVAAAIVLAVVLAIWQAVLLGAHLDARSAPLALFGLVLGVAAVDLLTGVVHWACDTWGDEHTPWLGPTLIYAFREHHQNPRAMVDHEWTIVNREPGVAAALALGLLSLPAAQHVLESRPMAHAFLWSFIAWGAAANQLHQWAHMERPPAPVRLAQRLRLVLSPEHHARHHLAPHTRAYCISTGWLNGALDRLRFWRTLERGISRLTGATARPAEHGNRRLQSS